MNQPPSLFEESGESGRQTYSGGHAPQVLQLAMTAPPATTPHPSLPAASIASTAGGGGAAEGEAAASAAAGGKSRTLTQLQRPEAPVLPKMPEPSPQRTQCSPLTSEELHQLTVALRNSTESYTGIRESIDKLSLVVHSGGQQVLSYRDAVDAKAERQRCALEEARSQTRKLTSVERELRDVVTAQADRLTTLEQETCALRGEVAYLTQAAKHAEDVARVADLNKHAAEVRQRELQVTVEHLLAISDTIRKSYANAEKSKEDALQRQFDEFERMRAGIVEVYDRREEQLINQLNATAASLHDTMLQTMKSREGDINHYWEGVIGKLQAQYTTLNNNLQQARDDLVKERAKMAADSSNTQKILQERCSVEIQNAVEMFQQRETDLLRSIAYREKDIGRREERFRVEQAESELERRNSLVLRENEMRSLQESALNRASESFEKERVRLINTFTDQLEKISNMHLCSERELERIHREKEMELVQCSRCAAGVMEDTTAPPGTTKGTQNSLIAKIDSMESRLRDRAATLKALFNSNAVVDATTPH